MGDLEGDAWANLNPPPCHPIDLAHPMRAGYLPILLDLPATDGAQGTAWSSRKTSFEEVRGHANLTVSGNPSLG